MFHMLCMLFDMFFGMLVGRHSDLD
jgi:hypothetical protein